MNTFDYRMIPTDEILMNEGETARRLNTAKGFESDVINECLEELKKVVSCKFSAVCCDVRYLGNDCLDIGFGKFESSTLIKNLQGCSKAFVFAVTLGMGVDRLLNKLAATSPARYFINPSASLTARGTASAYFAIRSAVLRLQLGLGL